MKEWKRSFRVPIYDCRIILVMTDDMVASQARLPKALRDSEIQPVGCGGFSVSTYPDYAILLPYHHISLDAIAHETGHVSRRIMHDIGFKISAENDEPLAYLEGYLTRRIHDIVKSGYDIIEKTPAKSQEGA